MRITRRQLAQIIHEETRRLVETPSGPRDGSSWSSKPLSVLLRELANEIEDAEETEMDDEPVGVDIAMIDTVIKRLEQFRGY